MAKFKQFLAIALVSVMTVAVAACGGGNGTEAGSDGEKTASSRQQLAVVKSNTVLPQEMIASRIKAEYLVENGGYADGDEVVAILSLPGAPLIDTYLGTETKSSLAEYAASPAGTAQTRGLEAAQASFVRDLQARGLVTEVTHTYSTVANAVAVRTTYANFLQLEALGTVSKAFLADTYALPQESSAADASAIVNAVDVYATGIFDSSSVADRGITGKHTAVAVLDSGFDLSHQVFDFKPEGELMYDRAAIGRMLSTLNAAKTTPSLKATDVYYSDKIPFAYDYADKDNDVFPYLSEHGTHVAGIIAGKADSYTDKDDNPVNDEEGNPVPFLGVAPDAQLVLMKVFPDHSEGAETDDILAALEDAVTLGVDCINMSLGAPCGFAREADGDLVNDVYDKIDKSGVSLLTASSNTYSSGYGGAQGNTNFVTNPDSGTVGSPSTYPSALSVASISGTKSKYLLGNGERIVFFNESTNLAAEDNDFFGELYDEMEWSKTDGAAHTVEYVTVPGVGLRVNYTGIDVKGKVALVRRGDNTFEEKSAQAREAGAIACMIYNNIDGDIFMSMGKSEHIPTISLSKEDGMALAAQSKGTLLISYANEAGPFMSDFSSWGPLPDLTLKPEITAHGGNILSSVPGGAFGEISGTSMATPNLCGIVVLIRQFLKQEYPDYGWKQISVLADQMMMSTATIVLDQQGNPNSPRKQGAGLASLYNVVNTKAYLTVDGNNRTKIELLDDPDRRGVYEMTFNLVNVSGETLHYDLGFVGMTESVSTADSDHVAERGQLLTSDYTAAAEGNGSLTDGKATVDPHGTLKIKLTYTLNEHDRNLIEDLFPYGMYVEGFIKLLAADEGGIDLNVPFLAYYGDWTQAPIFDKTYFEVEAEAHDLSIDAEDRLQADYYATTPYGSYFYNYLVPLGTYLYDVDASAYDFIPAAEEHAAISDATGSIDGISSVYAGLLRSCKTMNYTITDKVSGEVVWSHEYVNDRKAFSQGGAPIPNYQFLRVNSAALGFVNNRTYEFNMVGRLDYGDGGAKNNVRDSFTFDFTFDNEAPVVKDAVFETVYDRTLRKNRYYVTLTLYDNHYVQSVAPVGFDEYNFEESTISFSNFTSLPIPVYGDRGADTSVRLEITDYLEDTRFDVFSKSTIAFYVDDYALNSNIFLCTLPGTRGEFRFTSDGTAEGRALTTVGVGVDQIVDLTQYLYSEDPNLDEGRDYLKYLTWTSSRENVATVREGQVLGKRTGTTTITVTSETENLSAEIEVRVLPGGAATATVSAKSGTGGPVASPVSKNDVDDYRDANVSSVRFSYLDTLYAHPLAGAVNQLGETGSRVYISAVGNVLSCYPGERFRLVYDIDPWYVEDFYDLSWGSSNERVATVNENGEVEALARGSATITLRLSRDGVTSNLMASLRVTVQSEFITDDSRTLVAYKGRGGDVVIPDDEGILSIGPFAFSLFDTNYDYGQEVPDDDIYANRDPRDNYTVTSVTIPEGISQIQQHAFYHCKGLKSVTFLGKTVTIQQYAFYEDSELESINLDRVQVIYQHAFEGCTSLKWVCSAGITSKDAADNVLPHAYTIGERTFARCSSLEQLDLSALRNAGIEAFAECTSLRSVTFDEAGRTKLAVGIFRGSGLASVTLYETQLVPASAFADCASLESVTFSNPIVEVGEGAFENCVQLSSLTFEGTADRISDRAFANCMDLTALTLPNGAFALGEGVFDGCTQLQTVTLQQNTRIGEAVAAAFRGTGLTTFVADGSSYYTTSWDGKLLLADSGKTIVLAAIASLDTALTIGSEYESVASAAFSGASVETVDIQSANLRIGAYAFANCASLTAVTLPAGGAVIVGEGAFRDCPALATFDFTKVASVGDEAFAATAAARANKLTSVTLGAGAEVGEGAFLRSGLTALTVSGEAELGARAFALCTALQTVTLPENDVTLGEGCFEGDTSLETVDLSHLTEIPDRAFYGCTSLATAQLTEATSVGAYAFANCESLATLTVPAAETIGEGAFAQDERGKGPVFTAVTLPESLVSLGLGAFYGCGSLGSVAIPSKITEIPDRAFENCTALTSVTLGSGVVAIGDYAFGACAALTQIDLGGVETIGDYAFYATAARNAITGDPEAGAVNRLATVDLTSAVRIGTGAFAGTLVTGALSAPALTDLDDYAFYKVSAAGADSNDGILSLNAPKLEHIGYSALYGNANLASFSFGSGIGSVESLAFLGCTSLTGFTFGEGQTDGDINAYARLVDGVLYTKMQSGKYQLTAVPAGKQVSELVVQEGTYRIEDYAGNENKYIARIVLSDSLRTIGSYAFFGYTSLRSVEFRSVTAPVLEDFPAGNRLLTEGDPGYDVLHGQYDLSGYELGYFNFVDLAGRRPALTMILPANAESGYDSLVYRAYFGTVENAVRSEYVAMEQTMRDFLTYAERVPEADNVTMADERAITKAAAAMNAIKQDPAAYGYSQETWDALVKKVSAARERLARIKIANAKKIVRTVQALIDALPDSYDGSETHASLLSEVQTAISSLSTDDRNLLIQDRYNAFLASYEAYMAGNGPTGGEGGGDALGLIIGLSVAGGVILLAAVAAIVAVLVLRKKRAAGGTPAESAEESAEHGAEAKGENDPTEGEAEHAEPPEEGDRPEE